MQKHLSAAGARPAARIITLALAMLIAACQSSSIGQSSSPPSTRYPLTIQESNGSTVTIAQRPVRIVSQLGETLPLHATAAGKAYLAFESEDELRALLPDGLSRFTERTVVDRQTLLQQLRSITTSGYAVDMGEHVEDIRAVAVPVRDYTRNVVGTLAVAAPASRLTNERIEKEVAPLVLKAGRELSSRLGFDLGRREAQG